MASFKEIVSFYAYGDKANGLIFSLMKTTFADKIFLQIGTVQKGDRWPFRLSLKCSEVKRLVFSLHKLHVIDQLEITKDGSRNVILKKEARGNYNFAVLEMITYKMKKAASISVPFFKLDAFENALIATHNILFIRQQKLPTLELRDLIYSYALASHANHNMFQDVREMDYPGLKKALGPLVGFVEIPLICKALADKVLPFPDLLEEMAIHKKLFQIVKDCEQDNLFGAPRKAITFLQQKVSNQDFGKIVPYKD